MKIEKLQARKMTIESMLKWCYANAQTNNEIHNEIIQKYEKQLKNINNKLGIIC